MLRSVALLLDHALGQLTWRAAIDAAVDAALVSHPTRDAGGSATTTDFTDAVLASLDQTLAAKETAWSRPS